MMDIMHSTRQYRLEEALIASDINTKGNAHDGAADAYNTALLFAKIKTESKFALNPYYEFVMNQEETEFGTSLGDTEYLTKRGEYAMPEMDGPVTFEAIRADEKIKDIPVLFRTGKDDESLSNIMEKLQPAGVVSKADGKPQLMKAVADVLQASL